MGERFKPGDLSGFKDSARVRMLSERIYSFYPGGEHKIMEVCGTHTMAIARYGLRGLLPKGLVLLSGPGCPVCVTPASIIDAAIGLAGTKTVSVLTFGDMLSVPGSKSSLEVMRSKGADVRVLYSAYDMLRMADEERNRQFVFISVGFETTTPGTALAVMEVKKRGLENVSFLVANRLVIPAMDALMRLGEVGIEGFLCPGHVSVIIGSDAYRAVSSTHGVPCTVAGFEPVDILLAISDLTEQIKSGRHEVSNCYPRAVRPEGNEAARRTADTVFEECDAEWRGIGTIPLSGLVLRPEYREYDALTRFGIRLLQVEEPPGCRCGDVLKGLILPPECGLFGNRCTPDRPVGPCMVSSEGSCSAYFKYKGI
ncbi:MAG: hydrogenase formation protein HypD [Spirochaetes bacterium]|nr:hydrogenase formation protein HypD [Spirochaetota bacterium]